MLLRVIGCICFGVKRKLNGSYIPSITNNSWIDGSVEKYSQQFVEDVSAFLKVVRKVLCKFETFLIFEVFLGAEIIHSIANLLGLVCPN